MLPTKLAAWPLNASFPFLLLRFACNAARGCSATQRALGFDVERIDRLTRCHKEAVAFDPAEADVGTALRQHDAPDHLTVGSEHNNPVFCLAAGPRAPRITLDIHPHTV